MLKIYIYIYIYIDLLYDVIQLGLIIIYNVIRFHLMFIFFYYLRIQSAINKILYFDRMRLDNKFIVEIRKYIFYCAIRVLNGRQAIDFVYKYYY